MATLKSLLQEMVKAIPMAVHGSYESENKYYRATIRKYYPKNRKIVLEGLSSDLECLQSDMHVISEDYNKEYRKKKAEVLTESQNG